MVHGTVRVAAVGDLHCTRTSPRAFQPLFAQVADVADLLLLAGDQGRIIAEGPPQSLAASEIPLVRQFKASEGSG